MSGARFELAVFDEAHRMAGRRTRTNKFQLGLDDSNIALERRLFLTATPRTYKQPRAVAAAKRNATATTTTTTATADARGESSVTSMDNVTAFGPVVYQMTHQQAVARGIVTPLEILVYNVTDGWAELVKRTPRLEMIMGEYEISRENAELVQGLVRTFVDRNVSKVFSFHRTNRNAKRFERDTALLLEDMWASGGGAGETPAVLRVDSTMSATDRQRVLDESRGAGPSILANAKLLATGVDVPEVEGE